MKLTDIYRTSYKFTVPNTARPTSHKTRNTLEVVIVVSLFPTEIHDNKWYIYANNRSWYTLLEVAREGRSSSGWRPKTWDPINREGRLNIYIVQWYIYTKYYTHVRYIQVQIDIVTNSRVFWSANYFYIVLYLRPKEFMVYNGANIFPEVVWREPCIFEQVLMIFVFGLPNTNSKHILISVILTFGMFISKSNV